MVFKLVPFTIYIEMMVPAAKSTTKLACIEVSCVFNFNIFTHLVVDDLPVLALNSTVDLLVIGPIDVLIFALPLPSNSLEITKSMPITILMKWLTLRQFLEHLISCG